MNIGFRRAFSRWTIAVFAVLLAGIILLTVKAGRDCSQLSCTFQSGASVSQCENQTNDEVLGKTPSSDAQELVIERVHVVRDGSSALISAKLKGRFWNETDQNFYLFVGQTSPANSSVSYSLTADTQFLVDVSYPIRNTINLPHTNDVRVGVMAPGEVSYSPQIYITDPVRADLVGRDAHVEVKIEGNEVSFRLPLTDYYQRKGTSVPDRLSFTVATARDYVGFIDQMSVIDVGPQETKDGNDRIQPPVNYPVLNYDSHIVKHLTFKPQSDRSVVIELDMLSPITDWAQTNLHFFFVPVPGIGRGALPADPSHAITLPSRWSYYCAVYSPHRLFCKASHGTDFSYDTGYSERAILEQPKGIEFKELGATKYSLAISPEVVEEMKSGGNTFAALLTIGRDGFGPTSCFGFKCERRCNVLRRLRNFLP